METKRGQHEISFEKYFKILSVHLQPNGQIVRKCGRQYAKKKKTHDKVQRRPNLQEQRMENQMHTHGGSGLQRTHLWVRKLIMESAGSEQDQRMGNYHDENARRTRLTRIIWKKKSRVCRKSLLQVCGRFRTEVCEKRVNAVLDVIPHTFAWRSAC